MARIHRYPITTELDGTEKLVGSETDDSTKNFTVNDVLDYVTARKEVDPIFGASPAYGIEVGDISNWNSAFGWGDHADAGYAALTDFSVIAAAPGTAALSYNNSTGVFTFTPPLSASPFPLVTHVTLDSDELFFDSLTNLFSANPTVVDFSYTSNTVLSHVSFSFFGSISNWVAGTEYNLSGIITILAADKPPNLDPLVPTEILNIYTTTNVGFTTLLRQFDVLYSSALLQESAGGNLRMSFGVKVKALYDGAGTHNFYFTAQGMYPTEP